MRHFTLFVLFLLCVPVTGFSVTEQHLYRRQTGDTGHDFALSYSRGSDVAIEVSSDSGNERARCDADGGTQRWMLENGQQQTRVQVIRQKNTLHLSGTLAGKGILKTLQLDEAPWYQFLSWSLRDFLRSQQKKTTFWSLRPETMKAYKMEAENLGATTIVQRGESRSALQVRIRPTGLFSSFWHGDYWFEPTRLTFLRYEAVHGPPGTPKTRIEHLKTLTLP